MKYARRMILALLLLGGGAAFVGGLSTAVFTDTATIPNSTFTTGTLDLDLTDSNETAVNDTATSDITFTSMAPGDQIDAQITVVNSGIALRYALTVSSTNTDTKNLRDQLAMTVKSRGASATCALAQADVTNLALFSGSLNPGGGVVFGSTAQGAQAGDRSIAVSGNDILCFRVSLPLATGNSFQTASTTGTFSFVGEQTANNP